jgi:hypothetical protein
MPMFTKSVRAFLTQLPLRIEYVFPRTLTSAWAGPQYTLTFTAPTVLMPGVQVARPTASRAEVASATPTREAPTSTATTRRITMHARRCRMAAQVSAGPTAISSASAMHPKSDPLVCTRLQMLQNLAFSLRGVQGAGDRRTSPRSGGATGQAGRLELTPVDRVCVMNSRFPRKGTTANWRLSSERPHGGSGVSASVVDRW